MEAKKNQWKTLRHYTSVGWLKTILKNNRIKFSDACSKDIENRWDDHNDIFALRHYRQCYGKNPLVLCFTHSISIHHWEYYGKSWPENSSEEDKTKCCIVFDYKKIEALIEQKKRQGMDLNMTPVTYYSLKQLKNVTIDKEQLPFVKKYGFNVDKEERLVLLVENKGRDYFLTDIVDCIASITLYVKQGVPNYEGQINKIKADLVQLCPVLHKHIGMSALCDSKGWQAALKKSITLK